MLFRSRASQLSDALDRFDTDEERAPSESLFESDVGNSDLTDWDGEPVTGSSDSDRLSSILESSERDRISSEMTAALKTDVTASDESTADDRGDRVDVDAIFESDDETADETKSADDLSESRTPITDSAPEPTSVVGGSENDTDDVKGDSTANSGGSDDVNTGDTAASDGDGIGGDGEANDVFTFGASDEE